MKNNKMIKLANIRRLHFIADKETPEDLGRVVNAMIATKEFQEAKDDVKLIFDGAGTRWIAELSNQKHKYHSLFQQVRNGIAGACGYCAEAFKVSEDIKSSDIHLIKGYEGHPRFHRLISEGYQIITF